MNIIRHALCLPIDSPEHHEIRDELWICGEYMVARYYLSILTGKAYDFDLVAESDFFKDLRQFLATNISPKAVEFCFDAAGEGQVSSVVLPVLVYLFHKRAGMKLNQKPTKQDRALVLLLHNWTDAQIRDELKTTDKQMTRWSVYKLARIIQKRYRAAKGF